MATTRSAPAPKRAPGSRRDSPTLRARRALRSSLDVPRAARHSFRWDVLAGSCVGAYMGMTFPFLVRIARGDLQAPPAAIALMSAAPFVGNLLSPLWARQMEGKAKIPFCLGSWLPARSLLLLMPFALNPWLFVALVAGVQFIGTISSPAYTSLMRDIYPDRSRGRLMGYVRVGMQGTMFLATLVTGRLLDSGVSYRYLFPVAGLLGITAALSFAHVRPLATSALGVEGARTGSARAFVLDTLRILRENVGYRWFALSVFTYGFGNLMVVPLYALYQVDVLRISNTQIANLGAQLPPRSCRSWAFLLGPFHGPAGRAAHRAVRHPARVAGAGRVLTTQNVNGCSSPPRSGASAWRASSFPTCRASSPTPSRARGAVPVAAFPPAGPARRLRPPARRPADEALRLTASSRWPWPS